MEQHLQTATEEGLRILATGDVRLMDDTAESIFDEAVQSFVDGHQVRCCNFEGAAFHEGAVTNKKAGPSVLQGKGAAKRVLASGFNLIDLANNHIMDYGPQGLAATLNAFEAVTTLGAGETEPLACRPYILEQGGIKAGFLAFTERQYGTLTSNDGPGTAWICSSEARNNIRLLKSECSHVVVFCHAGLEDVAQPLRQWRSRYRSFIDAGATAVVCHHPHVPQGWERYKQGVIFYSLGNLAWEPEAEFDCREALMVSLTLLPEGEFSYTVRPTVFQGGRVRFDETDRRQAAMDEINLTLGDPKRYNAEIKAICRKFYEQEAVPDFFSITGSLPGDGWQKMKNAGKLMVRKPSLHEPLLRHILQNETYRWAVEEALKD